MSTPPGPRRPLRWAARVVVHAVGTVARAVADLVAGCACAGCRAPAQRQGLCGGCRDYLSRSVPSVEPGGSVLDVPLVSAAAYAGVAREVILSLKERGRVCLAGPLGGALAGSIAHALDVLSAAAEGVPDPTPQPSPGQPPRGLPVGRAGAVDLGVAVVLVPVPSSARARRRRHDEPLLRITRQAARQLRAQGIPAVVHPVLGVRGRPRDQIGLSARARAANVRGTFQMRRHVRPIPHEAGGPVVVVVDDVATTGATAGEAVRAVRAAGGRVDAVAVVARTSAARTGGPRTSDGSGGTPRGAVRSIGSHVSAIREM